MPGMKPLTCHYQFIDNFQKKVLVHIDLLLEPFYPVVAATAL